MTEGTVELEMFALPAQDLLEATRLDMRLKVLVGDSAFVGPVALAVMTKDPYVYSDARGGAISWLVRFALYACTSIGLLALAVHALVSKRRDAQKIVA